MKTKSKVLEGVKWFSLAQLVNNILSLIRMPLIAFFITPAEYGIMSIIYMLIALGTIFSDSGIGKAWIQKQTNDLPIFNTLFWLNIVVCIVIYLILYASKDLVSILFSDSNLSTYIPFACLGIIISSFGQQYSFLLDKELKFKQKAIVNFLSSIVGFLSLIILLYMNLKLWALIFSNLFSALIKSICFLIIGFKIQPLGSKFDFKKVKELLKFGFYQMGQRLTNFVYTNIDYLLIGTLINTTVLGLYYMAYSIVLKPISILNPVINKITFPIFSKIQNNIKQLQLSFLSINKTLSFIVVPFYIALIFLTPNVFKVFFNEEWSDAIPLVQILSIVGYLRVIKNIAGNVSLSKGDASLGFKYNLLSLITYLPAVYFGAMIDGARGIAISIALAQTFLIIPFYRLMIQKIFSGFLKDYFSSIFPSLIIGFKLAFVLGIVNFTTKDITISYALTIQVIISAVFLFYMYSKNENVKEIYLKIIS